MPDATIISDLHLGSRLCRAAELLDFLRGINAQPKGLLIVAGDTLESLDLRDLAPLHWQILAELRRLNAVWIAGNHDGPVEQLANLLGVKVYEEYRLTSGGKTALILHGDRFDSFITTHPILVGIGDVIYNAVQRVSARAAIRLKAKNKAFLHCAAQVRRGALHYAKRQNCDLVCCGHSHFAEVTGAYANSGSWTKAPGTWLEITDGVVALKEY